MAFNKSENLSNHMRVHVADKPYKCSVCNKSFTTFSRLQTHEHNVHSNRRPYDCNSIEVKTEADSSVITECSRDDKPTIGMFDFSPFIHVSLWGFIVFLQFWYIVFVADVNVAWLVRQYVYISVRMSNCISVTFMYHTEAVGWKKMPCGRDPRCVK